jgi:CSLREA domain-containing protein
MTRLGRAPCISSTQLSPGRRLCRLIRLLAPVVVPAIVVTALGCGKDAESPTSPAEPGGPDFSHTVGHKVVNSLADPGNGTCNATQCTLREAINNPQSTEISFASGLTGTITLARPGLGGGTLAIAKRLSITGPSAGIVIRRRSTDPEFRILFISSSASVKLANLIIRNGKTGQLGGGGGIINYGTLTLTHCLVAGNLSRPAPSGSTGGGISNQGGTLTLTTSAVMDNSDGGILNRGGTLTLTTSTVASNTVFGIANVRGTATVINSRIVDNLAGGINNTLGRFTLRRSTVARNSFGPFGGEGGGIANHNGEFTVANSTIASNSAGQGGGILNEDRAQLGSTITITNSTVSGNSARSGFGGGIFNIGGGGTEARVTLLNSTVVRNSAPEEGGGGIAQTGADPALRLTNSLVAQNSASTGPDVLDLGVPQGGVSARFSLIGNGSSSGITNTNGNQVGTPSNPIDPKIGPLADNGGPTKTHALLLGSPAIDAASTPDCPTTDQRGVLRPQGAACDIGSYERK